MTTKIPVTVTSFPELVDWLIDEHHEGVAFHMAEALSVSPSVVYQWKRNMIHRPSEANIQKIAMLYDLDPVAVLMLTYSLKPIAGGSWDGVPLSLVNPAAIVLLIRSWLYQILGLFPGRATIWDSSAPMVGSFRPVRA